MATEASSEDDATQASDADPAPQRALPDEPAPMPHATRARRVRDRWTFPAALGWTLLGAVLPGAGLLRTRWRSVGVVMLVVVALLAAVVGLLWLGGRDLLLTSALDPDVLTVVGVAIPLLGLVWAASVVVTHLALRPAAPTGVQRLLGSVVVGALVLAIVAPSFVAARSVYDTRELIGGVFTDDEPGATPEPTFGTATDPWASKPRLNILLLGGDSGESRDAALGIRTDTVILASIDTETGLTTLFSLPRQIQRMPFPEGSALAQRWPNGFTDGSSYNPEYSLNALYNNVPAMAPDLVPTGVRDPAAEILKMSVGTALGLDVDYYAMVNMDGFIEFVNALGGVTVNINEPVPVGGSDDANRPPDRWLPPGPSQHLNGTDALWFARGRYGSEAGNYARMARQRCVIQAVVQQANPTTVLTNYEALSKAGRNIVQTDVPNSRLPALLVLARKVQGQALQSVSFENAVDGFSTARPDWDLVRARVQEALAPPPAPEPAPEATVTSAPTTAPAPTETAAPEASDTAAPEATPTPETVTDECAYNPASAVVTPSPTPTARG
ncbi:LCP family protein [Propioniciclava soli]|uniref:LCP family protein n=1 Tax=Propioniciclava soli TaxID=2775081 RepID=UPI001E4BEAE4|nr:LCP family protein [Propioniciclava soli]